MRILAILAILAGYRHGSVCVEFGLFDMTDESILIEGAVEGIGCSESTLHIRKKDGAVISRKTEAHNCAAGVILALESLLSGEFAVVQHHREIIGVGHRIMHGGERFKEHCIVDEKVLADLRECISLAPLHNLYNIIPMEICRDLLPGVPQVAVFDTCFHQSLPDYAYIYGIPYEYYIRYGIRRFGFHGISHQHMMTQAAILLSRSPKEMNLITCHLGEGASITAIKGGKSFDTSMGFTPLEGLLMTTRCGDIDGAIIPYLMERNGLTRGEIEGILNRKSGLLGISSISGDIKELILAMDEGSYRAKLALEIYCYRLKKYISAYAGALGGVDAILFTGDIGAQYPYVREQSLSGLDFMGILLDDEKNRQGEKEISSDKSNTKIFVIPSGEKRIIAKETYNLVNEM